MRSRLLDFQSLVDDNICVRIGVGDSLFWSSNWLGSGCLSRFSVSPSHPDLALNVAYSNDGWQVHLFADDLPASVLAEVLGTTLIFTPIPDGLAWKSAATGSFTVSSAYELIRQKMPVHLVLRNVWRPEIPMRISIFDWKLPNGLLPFRDVLRSMGFQLASRCPFCQQEDTLHHGFLQCPQAAALWTHFAVFFRFALPSPGADLWDILQAFWEDAGPVSSVLRHLPLAISWILWKARNSLLYGSLRTPFHKLVAGVMEHKAIHCWCMGRAGGYFQTAIFFVCEIPNEFLGQYFGVCLQ